MTTRSRLSTHLATLIALSSISSIALAAEPTEQMERARSAYDRGDWDEAISLYEGVYGDVDDASPLKAEAALESSSILWEQGSYKRAKKRAERALELAETIEFDAAIGRLYVTIGHIEASQGKLGKARKTFNACAAVTRENKDEVFGAVCRMNIAMLDRIQGRRGQSDAQFKRDIALLESANTPLAAGSALAKTGELYAKNGDFINALVFLDKAHDRFVAAGSVPAEARNHVKIARVMQSSGQWDKARAHLKMAQGPLIKMKNRPALVDVEGLLGDDAKHSGQTDKAKEHFNKALAKAKSIGSPQLIARSNLALCELLGTNKREPGAETHCAQAASGFSKLRSPELEARAKIVQANLAQSNGNLARARDLYKEIIDLIDGKSDASVLATQRANLCQINNSLEITGTLLSCKKALEALDALPNKSNFHAHIATVNYVTGFAAQREKRMKEALRFFEKAAAQLPELDRPDMVRAADAHLRMGIIYSVVLRGEEDSIKAFRRGIKTVTGHEHTEQGRVMMTQLRQQLVQQLVNQSDWDDALVECDALISFATPHSDHATIAWAQNNKALAALKSGDKQGAIAALKAGVSAAKKAGNQKELLSLMKGNLKKLEK